MNISITLTDLQQLLPNTPTDTLERYQQALQQFGPQYGINSALRWCHCLAQLAHESAGFRATSENLNYSAKALRSVFGRYFPTDELANSYARQPERIANRVYANRMGNADEASGDGWLYRGRGLIQLTGKSNYQRLSTALQIDLINAPQQLANDAALAVQSAFWFWQHNNLNTLADADQLQAITRRINGGLHGLTQREALLQQAKQIYAAQLLG
jgi:putative chitinase